MRKRVLVAPLNWGLGHATRCIPIIEVLLQQGAEVILASDGRAYELLKKEFPELIIEKLPAYNIHYKTSNMLWNMGTQSLKILLAIFREHRQLQHLIDKHRIDFVIADNRFGCFSRKATCIFITHQINIRLPFSFVQWSTRFINRFLMRRFDAYWIPDVAGKNSIAGELAQSAKFSNLQYVGILSRMQPLHLPKRYDLIVVLSGPEPQRTRLEQLILQQAAGVEGCILLVQGKPEAQENVGATQSQGGHINIVPFLNTQALNEAMAASDLVVCRSGYSTIMDLAVLGKRAIFIPTPGQTEQEYLAESLFEKGLFYFQSQKEFNLAKALQKAPHFSGFQGQEYQQSKGRLQQAVQKLLSVNFYLND